MLQKPTKCQGLRAMQTRPGNNMSSKRNHLLYHFSITIYPTSPVFMHKILLKKLGKMHIEQIIEFQLREPGPSGRSCAPITG